MNSYILYLIAILNQIYNWNVIHQLDTVCFSWSSCGQQQSKLAHNMSNEGRRKLYPQKHKDSFSATWQIILLVLVENFVRLLNSRDFKFEFYLNLYSEVNEFPSLLTAGSKVFRMRKMKTYSFIRLHNFSIFYWKVIWPQICHS